MAQNGQYTVGMQYEYRMVVGEADTAAAQCSGSLRVFATPRLVALMEAAAVGLLEDGLAAGQTSVGIRIAVDHTRATPVGDTVRAVAELTAVEERILTFSIVGYDSKGEIGRAEHKRCLVDAARFMGKLEGR